jgi:hypothetical protein
MKCKHFLFVKSHRCMYSHSETQPQKEKKNNLKIRCCRAQVNILITDL